MLLRMPQDNSLKSTIIGPNQSDQIWRNFATLCEIFKDFGNL